MAFSREEFLGNEVLALAVVRLIEIVGEAASKVTDSTRARFPDVPWQDAADMRNHVAHQYFNVDLQRVWDTVQNDIPELVLLLDPVLRQMQAGNPT